MKKDDKIGIIISVAIFSLTFVFIINQLWFYQIGLVSNTKSMNPTLSVYDITVSNQQFNYSDLEKGDIVNIDDDCGNENNGYGKGINGLKNTGIKIYDTSFTTHRIVENTSSGYYTKGDNNSYIDQRVDCIDYLTKDNYESKVIEIYEFPI